MPERRRALIVANDQYDAAGFKQLAAPANDAQALRDVLSDPAVGAFDVQVLPNPTTQEARLAVQDFFVEVKRDDLLLLHFSCHGVKSPEGELFLAMRDTLPDRLAATGLPADFVNEQMATSRAQQIALFLDCCFGGAFDRGMRARAGGNVNVKDAFQRQETVRAGRARVVVAAAGDVQYALEGGSLVDRHDQPSVFTSVVVEALATGKADRDGDGWVGIYELFDYVSDHVAEVTTSQTPELSTFGAHGDMLLAHSQARLADPAPVEPELAELLASTLTNARLNGIAELRSRALDTDLDQAAAARRELERRSSSDPSETVRRAAREAVDATALGVEPRRVGLGRQGSAVVELGGPPLARQVRATADADWLSVEHSGDRLVLGVHEGSTPSGLATLTVAGPTGEVHIEVVPPSAPSPHHTWWWVVAAAIGVVAVVAGLVAWRLADGGESPDDHAATLPQGEALADDVLVWMVKDDSGHTQIQTGTPGSRPTALASLGDDVANPVLTADRRTLLYRVVDPVTARATIWAAGSGGEDPQRIIDDLDCPEVGRPAVNPAATELAVTCPHKGGPNSPGIRIYSVGGDLLRILDAQQVAGGPTWSADASMIVYWHQAGAGDSHSGGDIYAIGAHDEEGTGDPLTRGAFRDEQPVLTPDLRTLVFVRHPEGDQSVSRLYRLDLSGGDGTLSRKGDSEPLMTPDDTSDTAPAVSPDGSELAFTRDHAVFTMGLTDGAGSPQAAPSPPDQVFHLSWARR